MSDDKEKIYENSCILFFVTKKGNKKDLKRYRIKKGQIASTSEKFELVLMINKDTRQ